LAEETKLRDMVASGLKAATIARKLKRSTGAVYARIYSLKRSGPLPSERAVHFHANASVQSAD
jgi:hypothetical protein